MKRILQIIILMFIANVVFAQVQRLVLLEHFTQASCPPCATYNPAIKDLLDNNPGKIVAIKYHTWWPGYDPMYEHNIEDIQARVPYYDFSGVPNSVVDGNYYNGHPTGWGQEDIDTRYAVPAQVAIELDAGYSANNDSITVTLTITPQQNLSGDIRAHVVIVEKMISFTTPPGTNGETDFPMVMKKMCPSAEGTAIGSLTSGEAVEVKTAWKYENIYDMDQLAVVAFVQNHETQDIYQAAYENNLVLTPQYDLDAGIVNITNIGDKVCLTSLKPKMILQSNGSTTLTSATITYSFNGEDEHTYEWTGDLDFLEYNVITLEEIAYEKMETGNNLTISLTNINGGDDEFADNNVFVKNFDAAPLATNTLYFKLKPDDNPGEIEWIFQETKGDILYGGGPYSASTLVERTFRINKAGCFDLIITDEGEDGLLEGGFFMLDDENGLSVADDLAYEDEIIVPVEVYGPPPFTVNYPSGSDGVPVDTVIIITFEQALQLEDDTPIGDINDYLQFRERDVTGPEVGFSATLNEAQTEIALTPDAEMTYSTNYFITIMEGLEGDFNNFLPETVIAFTTESEVSIEEGNWVENIELYPNPASGDAFIAVQSTKNSEFVLKIYSTLGQLVVEKYGQISSGNNTIKVNCSTLENGIYLVKISMDEEAYLQKLMIKK